jgi:hypothetical protein
MMPTNIQKTELALMTLRYQRSIDQVTLHRMIGKSLKSFLFESQNQNKEIHGSVSIYWWISPICQPCKTPSKKFGIILSYFSI